MHYSVQKTCVAGRTYKGRTGLVESMEDAGIYARESSYLDRHVQIGVASKRVISVSFPDTAPADSGNDHPVLDRIEAYLDGAADDFEDVNVGLTVPTDQRAILESVRGIPYGETVTVETLLRMTSGLDHDSDEDRQTARTALASNPVPLLIPDHRVSDGPSGAPSVVERKLEQLEA
jgi:methylated-DNA-[protein]-cysteine S-methyltransferase